MSGSDASDTGGVEVAYGTAAAVDLEPGQVLRIEVREGNQAGDLSFVGFDQGRTRNINGFAHFGRPVLPYYAAPGMVLVDGTGEAVLEVGPMTAEGNDIMMPGCWREIYDDGRAGCQDLVSEALGIERAALTGMLSFFAVGRAHENYFDGLVGTSARPGVHCSFVARRAVTVGVSACPDRDMPDFVPGVLTVEVS